MTDDPRTNTEIAWCIYIKMAANYLWYLTIDERHQRTMASIYKTGDIKKWAIEKTNEIISRANALQELPSPYAQSVAGDSLASLVEIELSGYVLTPVVLSNNQ